jgi:PAS domain S-box-containing protein
MATDASTWQRFLSECALDMLSCHDLSGIYRYVTPSCSPLLGYEPGDLVGHSAYEFFHPDDLGIIRNSHDKIRSGPGISTRIIYRIRKKSGEFTWFESTSRVFESFPNMTGPVIYATSRDVSEKVAFEMVRDRLVETLGTEPPGDGRYVPEWESIITMCAWTGRIKYRGAWLGIEAFLEQRFGLHVTHGMTPDAAARLLALGSSSENE